MSEKPGAGGRGQGAGTIAALLDENRTYPPAPAFATQANVPDESIYAEAERDPEGFWAKIASELDWFTKWDRVLEWKSPDAKWFVGGKLNVSYNCVDRHLRGAAKEQGRDRLGGRTGRPADAHLLGSPPRGLPLCERAEEARRCEG